MNLTLLGVALLLLIVFASRGFIAFVKLRQEHELQLRKLALEETEAEIRLLEAQAKLALPEYIDANDSEAVAAYARARRELEGKSL